MNSRIRRNNKGFTLIELMIAMVIFVIIVALIADNYNKQQGQNITQNQVTEIQQNARAGFHMIISEIRMAGFDPYGNYGAEMKYSITVGAQTVITGANSLAFTYVADNDGIDNDGDSNTDEEGELKTIAIRLYDSNIDSGATNDEIQMLPGGQPVAENIGNLQFEYFDQNGNEINPVSGANVGNIKAIRAQLTARPDETERDLMEFSGGSNRTLDSMIKLRNI